MNLSEDKTYRTRDGLRTGIRVKRHEIGYAKRIAFRSLDGSCEWFEDGRVFASEKVISDSDLIEEQPAVPQPFSYDACPVGEDGHRRAVTRDGREVVLLCNDGPAPFCVLVGIDRKLGAVLTWPQSGKHSAAKGLDLLVPPPPKRVVWVNLYDKGYPRAAHFATESEADKSNAGSRLGNRAYPIEIGA